MQCSKAFRGNANGVIYRRNITSHVGFPRHVSRKYDHTRKSPKMSQKQSIMNVIIHAFGLSRDPTSERNATGCLLRTWEVIGKECCGLERICGCLYVHFETILGFLRNEQMWCSETFRSNVNGTKHPCNVTRYFGFPRNVSGENMTRPGEVQKMS